jgi:antitoxin (DNA-binding transcriptional repressor) of toxin-antitoxin stability system
MKHRVVSATDFKARCLALLDEIDENGGTITITKRGRAVALVAPATRKPWKSLKGAWSSKVKIVGDIVHADTTHLWNALGRE